MTSLVAVAVEEDDYSLQNTFQPPVIVSNLITGILSQHSTDGRMQDELQQETANQKH